MLPSLQLISKLCFRYYSGSAYSLSISTTMAQWQSMRLLIGRSGVRGSKSEKKKIIGKVQKQLEICPKVGKLIIVTTITLDNNNSAQKMVYHIWACGPPLVRAGEHVCLFVHLRHWQSQFLCFFWGLTFNLRTHCYRR